MRVWSDKIPVLWLVDLKWHHVSTTNTLERPRRCYMTNVTSWLQAGERVPGSPMIPMRIHGVRMPDECLQQWHFQREKQSYRVSWLRWDQCRWKPASELNKHTRSLELAVVQDGIDDLNTIMHNWILPEIYASYLQQNFAGLFRSVHWCSLKPADHLEMRRILTNFSLAWVQLCSTEKIKQAIERTVS